MFLNKLYRLPRGRAYCYQVTMSWKPLEGRACPAKELPSHQLPDQEVSWTDSTRFPSRIPADGMLQVFKRGPRVSKGTAKAL
jgi:hypothetical protein